jgi:hypothetical protein
MGESSVKTLRIQVKNIALEYSERHFLHKSVSLTLSKGVQGPTYIRTAWDNCLLGEQAMDGQSRTRGEKKTQWYVLLPVMRPEMLQIQANFGTEKAI